MAKFLYNGVELPQVPDFTYVAILRKKLTNDIVVWGVHRYSYLRALGSPCSFMTEDGSTIRSYSFFTMQYHYEYTLVDGAWQFYRQGDHSFRAPCERDYELIWQNFTITDVNTDQIVYPAGSEPVPAPETPVYSIDHTAMIQGWIVGKRLAAMRGKPMPEPEPKPEPKPEPVAYLYNGYRCPKIPATPTGSSERNIILVSERVYYFSSTRALSSDGKISLSFTTEKRDLEDGAWSLSDYYRYNGGSISKLSIIWANFDIYNFDGTLYLAASEPVPVYE